MPVQLKTGIMADVVFVQGLGSFGDAAIQGLSRTDDRLWPARSGSCQAELAQLVSRLLGELVQPCLGALFPMRRCVDVVSRGFRDYCHALWRG